MKVVSIGYKRLVPTAHGIASHYGTSKDGMCTCPYMECHQPARIEPIAEMSRSTRHLQYQ